VCFEEVPLRCTVPAQTQLLISISKAQCAAAKCCIMTKIKLTKINIYNARLSDESRHHTKDSPKCKRRREKKQFLLNKVLFTAKKKETIISEKVVIKASKKENITNRLIKAFYE
jgi:hypothetical protein